MRKCGYCERPARGNGEWCERHRQRVAKYGRPDDTPRVISYRVQKQALERVLDTDAMEDGPCWSWPGPTNPCGYGVVAPSLAPGYGTRLASRVTWIKARGSLARNELVCHRCDNPACFRPSHLFVGSHADNSADMVAKGRSPQTRNEASGRAKLTNADVSAIRAMHSAGASHAEIGRRFGIHPAHSSRICRGLRRPSENPAEALRLGISEPRIGRAAS